jgi:hypothetical protein
MYVFVKALSSLQITEEKTRKIGLEAHVVSKNISYTRDERILYRVKQPRGSICKTVTQRSLFTRAPPFIFHIPEIESRG